MAASWSPSRAVDGRAAVVRDLIGTVETQKAQMGVLITMAEPTPGVLDAANHGGTYTWRSMARSSKGSGCHDKGFAEGKRPDMPQSLLPYVQAAKAPPASVTHSQLMVLWPQAYDPKLSYPTDRAAIVSPRPRPRTRPPAAAPPSMLRQLRSGRLVQAGRSDFCFAGTHLASAKFIPAHL